MALALVRHYAMCAPVEPGLSVRMATLRFLVTVCIVELIEARKYDNGLLFQALLRRSSGYTVQQLLRRNSCSSQIMRFCARSCP